LHRLQIGDIALEGMSNASVLPDFHRGFLRFRQAACDDRDFRPCAAKVPAIPLPIPLLAPVTTTILSFSGVSM
ncbi:hypothetical protein, partial [Brevibacillus laterosporus]|uniref:hypothetical protein n=1 Tax=Brevibacillus laterosporus TaxID=1465 RepID=UPI0035A2F204